MTQQINLIDPSTRMGRDWLSGMSVVAIIAVSTMAVAAHYGHERSVWQRVNEVSMMAESQAQASSSTVQQLNEQVGQMSAQIAADDQLRQAQKKLLDPVTDSVSRLETLVSVLPETVWLRQLEMTGSRGIRIAGSSLKSAHVAQLTQALSQQAAFSGVPVQVLSLERRDDKDASVYEFELSSLPAGAAP